MVVEYQLSLRQFYKTTIRPTMLYGIAYWAIKKQHIHKMRVVKMRTLRWISENLRKDRVWNEESCLCDFFGLKGLQKVICKWEQLMHQWGRGIWFMLREQKEVQKKT